jgi:predicted amidohydrolase
VKAAAIQMEPVLGDVAENLRRAELLVDEAAAAGADWIILPEFFSTGMGYADRMADAALPADGPALDLLRRLARRHSATVGGSFICRDADGHNRNAFFLVGPRGDVLGRHDKDLPTMWENCYYVGGDDDGVIEAGQVTAGAAVCWEFMRTQTAHRLRGKVDLIVGGSAWWSIPPWHPKALMRRLEANNARTAAGVASAMARVVGAPVVHSAHCGPIECGLPLSPVPYRGSFEGGAVICDARGEVLARREAHEGPGVVVADLEPVRRAPLDAIPDRFWFHDRGALASFMWFYQNRHGSRWYRRHAMGRPTAQVGDSRPTVG